MGYDEGLAQRIRELLADEPGLTEKRMFGGLAFLLDGHMAVAANSRGGLMVRAAPDGGAHPLLSPMQMRGRTMKGWLATDDADELDDADLARCVWLGVDLVRTLPPKR